MTTTHILYIAIAMLLIWNIGLTAVFFQQRRFFTQFTKGVSKNDLKSILKNIASSLKTAGNELSDLESQIKQIQIDNTHHIQRLGFVRFNPFSDTGGDQSFCACLLDQNNTGFIITSFHSREQTRIYAKSIIKGKCKDSELSKEETEALKSALKAGPKPTKTKK